MPWSRWWGRQTSSGWYAGWTSGCSTISSENTWLTQSITAADERKLALSSAGLGADLLGGAEVLGDVGAPEAVDRLLRVADDEQPFRVWPELSPVGLVRRVVGEWP